VLPAGDAGSLGIVRSEQESYLRGLRRREGDEPIAALEACVRSVRYDAAYWRGKAVHRTAVWSIAVQYCLTDHRRKLAQQPNCRSVLQTAVDLTRELRATRRSEPSSEQPPDELIYVVEERRTGQASPPQPTLALWEINGNGSCYPTTPLIDEYVLRWMKAKTGPRP
jgi:hypothetical protein